jgi:uncharacterized protein (DUF1778 family)
MGRSYLIGNGKEQNIQKVRGRPPIAGAKRNSRFPLRMSAADKDLLQKVADKRDVSLGAFIREAAATVEKIGTHFLGESIPPSTEITFELLLRGNEKESFAGAAVVAGRSLNAFLRESALWAARKN